MDYQDKWQRTQLGIVTVNCSRDVIDRTFQAILQDVDIHIDGEITRSRIDYF